MPSVLNEGRRTGEFLVSEASGYRSRDQGQLMTDEPLPAGTVLGRITATGTFVPLNPGADDGGETPAAILYANAEASESSQPATVILRDAEVNAHCLEWPAAISEAEQAAAEAALTAAGLIPRR
ncbi:head decoration protein [Fodinicurvata sp. EGI_FJ10296]|uniref:head decoration protein n=1 Tax=Fodinicurvata sp. EGI_FJ10296 TaxID=3231908 RepID=UPI0034559877